ncbi:hypothetical protein J7L67_06260, partial [bacterium]|nr:hypothetical protein [bacterium]
LYMFKYSGKNLYELSELIKSITDFNGRTASNTNWYQSIIVSYYLGQVYHGAYYKNATVDELKKDMLDADIDYYFLWMSNPFLDKRNQMRMIARYSFISQFPELTKGKIKGLKIYDVRRLKK